jgi:hypothetical protein
MQIASLLGFPDPRHPAGPEGMESRRSFMRPFAPCFASPLLVRPVYPVKRPCLCLPRLFV